jgi:thiol-disulfide isomerase/thioredoxin
MDGSNVNLADLKGKKVFVNLWATWCPPCRAEIPSIEALSSKVDKQKVAFVMLSLDENINLPKQFAKTNKLQLPVFYPAEGLPAMFKTDGIPATFIFNEKGELIKQNMGAEDYDTNEYVQLLK